MVEPFDILPRIMKVLPTFVAFILPMCAALNLGAQTEELDPLSAELAAIFQQEASAKEPKFQYEHGQVICGGKKATFTPVTEQALEHQGRFIQAARIEVSVDGAAIPALTFGAVGVGASREDADRTAIQEWYMAAGKAVIAAVGRQKPESTLGGYAVHAGFMGTRGASPGGWLQGTPEMNAKILKVILPLLPKGASTIAIDLKVAIQPGSAPDGQCLINGQPSAEAIQAVKGLDWPRPASSYLLKQAYVLQTQD